jgi:hypothetical protein
MSASVGSRCVLQPDFNPAAPLHRGEEAGYMIIISEWPRQNCQ